MPASAIGLYLIGVRAAARTLQQALAEQGDYGGGPAQRHLQGRYQRGWDAIGEVIKAWATEGHAVAIPGLGRMRFGLRSKSIADVNKVGSDLITTRRVIFVPNVDIKDELKRTSINITCYDRNGEVVKRVTSSDEGNVEDPENEGAGSTVEGSGNSGTTEPGGGSGNGSVTPTEPNTGGDTGGDGGNGGDDMDEN